MSISLPPASDEKINYTFVIKNPHKIALILFMSFFVWLLAKNAWYGDDGFITMRVIDNFVNGYGLVWNVGERVQVFTHPLWLMLMTPVYALFRDPSQTIYWVSLVVSLITIFLFLSKFTKTYRSTVVAGLMIAASMAFIDYSSSGLENPLTHLLLIIFLMFTLKQPTSLKSFFITALLASLSAVNRLDTILFFIPALGYQLYELRASWPKALAYACMGFIPLLVWELFSLLYYGFPFPNTYYAKVASTNVPIGWFHNQGWEYFKNSFRWDPITLGIIGAGIIFVLWECNLKKISILLGMVFYLYYVYSIGGDFMSGRFFSAAFLVAATLLMTIDMNVLIGKTGWRTYLFTIGAIIFLGLAADYPPVFTKNTDSDPVINFDGIANEKLFYFNVSNWYNHDQSAPMCDWAKEGIDAKFAHVRYAAYDSVGFFGYYAGPGVYVFDNLALGDPLRSKLPVLDPTRIGHMTRAVPPGYEETLKNQFKNHIDNPDLHLYYDKLSILIHDGVFSPGRLQEIVQFNLGRYNDLILSYNNTPGPK